MAHEITITWATSSGIISGYNIYRGTAPGNESAVHYNVSLITTNSFTDPAVFPGLVYVYKVTAVAGASESSGSLEVMSAPVPYPFSPPRIGLGLADSFAILGGSAVTNTGPVKVSGDVGVWPGTSITGFDSASVIAGVFHPGDFVAANGQTDITTVYTALQSMTGSITSPADLGGLTLDPGVYSVASSEAITGVLILDAAGDPNATWVFQIGSTLTTATNNSNIVLVGGAEAANVFWQVGSSATLGVGTTFVGTILAQASITVNTGVIVNGRLFARTGAITLDHKDVIIYQSCALVPLPPSAPNVPPPLPLAPTDVTITSET